MRTLVYSPAGFMFGAFFYPWGIVLQAMAILHFIRRRPETFWLWIILFGGGVGALVYMVAEVVPDVNLLGGAVQRMSRRRRLSQLEAIDRKSTRLNSSHLGISYAV